MKYRPASGRVESERSSIEVTRVSSLAQPSAGEGGSPPKALQTLARTLGRQAARAAFRAATTSAPLVGATTRGTPDK